MQKPGQANPSKTLDQPYTPGHIDGLFDPRTIGDLAMIAAMGILLLTLILA